MTNTNSAAIAQAIVSVISNTEYANDFWQGLTFGFGVMLFCFALSMVRSITGDNTEDL
jgi:hypothetical protein